MRLCLYLVTHSIVVSIGKVSMNALYIYIFFFVSLHLRFFVLQVAFSTKDSAGVGAQSKRGK